MQNKQQVEDSISHKLLPKQEQQYKDSNEQKLNTQSFSRKPQVSNRIQSSTQSYRLGQTQ